MKSTMFTRIKKLVRENPNDMTLGSAIRALVLSIESPNKQTSDPSQISLESSINEIEQENRSNNNDVRL